MPEKYILKMRRVGDNRLWELIEGTGFESDNPEWFIGQLAKMDLFADVWEFRYNHEGSSAGHYVTFWERNK